MVGRDNDVQLGICTLHSYIRLFPYRSLEEPTPVPYAQFLTFIRPTHPLLYQARDAHKESPIKCFRSIQPRSVVACLAIAISLRKVREGTLQLAQVLVRVDQRVLQDSHPRVRSGKHDFTRPGGGRALGGGNRGFALGRDGGTQVGGGRDIKGGYRKGRTAPRDVPDCGRREEASQEQKPVGE